MNTKHSIFSLCFIWACALISPLHAGQVTWLSKAFSVHQTSQGALLDATFVFELGAFDSGFTPSSGNTAEWAAKWNVADRVNYNVTNQIFGGTYSLSDNAAPFTTSARGFIWGYSTSGDNEWILISDPSWLWPDSTDTIAFPSQWLVSSATNVIVGTVDPSEATYFLRTAKVNNGVPPRQTGDQWLAENFSAAQLASTEISAWDQDPDGDRLTNLVEMALGSDPLAASGENLPIVRLVKVGGLDYLQMEVEKSPTSTVDFAVEVTDDFVNWLAGPLVTETLVDTPLRLVVRDKTPIIYMNSRFLRLTVQLQD